MRPTLVALPLALLAAPAPAQSPQPEPDRTQGPRELTDPALVGKLTKAMEALSDAFLNLPVGEVEAAIEGRPPTAADRRRTVRSQSRISERELKQRIAEARPAMDAGMRALAEALPAMIRGMAEARESLERAAANLPRPDYPKR